MDLRRWWKGLNARLFSNGATAVRLYCADGQVLSEIYEKSRKEDEPDLKKKKELAAQDFFRAVITGILEKREIARSRPLRIKEIADYFEDRARNGGYDWEILPLCFFFVAVWSIDFQDADNRSYASNYRGRFDKALKMGGGCIS